MRRHEQGATTDKLGRLYSLREALDSRSRFFCHPVRLGRCLCQASLLTQAAVADAQRVATHARVEPEEIVRFLDMREVG